MRKKMNKFLTFRRSDLINIGFSFTHISYLKYTFYSQVMSEVSSVIMEISLSLLLISSLEKKGVVKLKKDNQ